MGLVQVSTAGAEAITVTQAQQWLRVDSADDVPLISTLITAAREYAEIFCRRSFLANEVWALTIDNFPLAVLRDALYFHEADYGLWENEAAYFSSLPSQSGIEIPMGPVSAINSISYLDGNGVSQVLAASAYFTVADDDGNPRIYPVYGTFWPVTQAQPGAVTINFTTGSALVPQDVITAMQMMIARDYAYREGVVPAQNTQKAIELKLWPHRLLEL